MRPEQDVELESLRAGGPAPRIAQTLLDAAPFESSDIMPHYGSRSILYPRAMYYCHLGDELLHGNLLYRSITPRCGLRYSNRSAFKLVEPTRVSSPTSSGEPPARVVVKATRFSLPGKLAGGVIKASSPARFPAMGTKKRSSGGAVSSRSFDGWGNFRMRGGFSEGGVDPWSSAGLSVH